MANRISGSLPNTPIRTQPELGWSERRGDDRGPSNRCRTAAFSECVVGERLAPQNLAETLVRSTATGASMQVRGVLVPARRVTCIKTNHPCLCVVGLLGSIDEPTQLIPRMPSSRTQVP